MFHFIIPLIKGRLIGLALNRLFPVVVRILKNQQVKKQHQDFSKEQKTTIDVKAREKKQNPSLKNFILHINTYAYNYPYTKILICQKLNSQKKNR